MPLIIGNQQDNILYGSYDNDTLRGHAGNDRLMGHDGNDILDGGTGNDILEDGRGNNTYLFKRGDGQDRIQSFDSTLDKRNTIRFGDDIAPEDIVLQRMGLDLIFQIAGTSDTLTVVNYFETAMGTDGPAIRPFAIEEVLFADGTSWDHADMLAKVSAIVVLDDAANRYTGGSADGRGGDDELIGGWQDDVLIGGAGNDVLRGSDGNDVLIGGAGNDLLVGGHGVNTYQFGAAWGNDTIELENNLARVIHVQLDTVLPGSLKVERLNGTTDLLIGVKGASDTITLKNFFNGNLNPYALRVELADHSVMTWDQIHMDMMAPTPVVRTGTEANDYLHGGAERDLLQGLGGDDTLEGYDGDDTLEGGAGYDRLNGGRGNDRLDGGDGGGQLIGADGNDILLGGLGNDMLHGGEGNDVLNGGAGRDLLDGGRGNNTILFGRTSGQDELLSVRDTSHTIVFDADVRPEDIVMWREGDYRVFISIRGTDAQILVPIFRDEQMGESHLSTGVQLQFADGRKWGDALLFRNIVSGTDGDNQLYGSRDDDILDGKGGNDLLEGYLGNDRLLGGDGNDILFGHDGSDVLIGGKGDDRLDGGRGNNTMHFNRGDGFDMLSLAGVDRFVMETNTIVFGSGIVPDDVLVTYPEWGGAIELRLKGSLDVIAIHEFRVSGRPDAQLVVRFATGEAWDNAAILARRFIGDEGDNQINGSSSDDLIDGRGGNDRLTGWLGNDVLFGGSGNDVLAGGDHNDVLVGGTGNDIVQIEQGSDTVRFARGDGADVVALASAERGTAAVTTIEFAAGIHPDDVRVRYEEFGSSTHLIMEIKGSTDQIRLQDFRAYGKDALVNVRFANGDRWDHAELLRRPYTGDEGDNHLVGSARDDGMDGRGGNDVLFGADGNDVIAGGAGNDLLDGGRGNDTLTGGTGDDQLMGGGGTDTFRFALGDGYDKIIALSGQQYAGTSVIEFAAGIKPQDVVIGLSGNPDNGTLIFTFKNSADALAVSDYRNVKLGEAPLTVRFADGTSWDNATLARLLLTGTEGGDVLIGGMRDDVIVGLGGNDQLHGGAGNDTLIGGAGDDLLFATTGNDTVHFARGDGADNVVLGGLGRAPGIVTTVSFGAGIGPDDVAVALHTQGQLTNLILRLRDSGEMVVLEQFRAVGAAEAQLVVRFADGDSWDNAMLARQLLTGDQHANVIRGTEGNDVIDGRGGGDVLDGAGGDDMLRGGEGNDRLDGGAGNDSYLGGSGNDELIDSAGSDVVVLNRGDGSDVLRISALERGTDVDLIRFGEGISAADLRIEVLGSNEAVIHYGDGDLLRVLRDGDGGQPHPVSHIAFHDGSTLAFSELINRAPMVVTPIADLRMPEGGTLEFAIPEGTFVDQDQHDVLTYALAQANGDPLPAWLSMDPQTRVITAKPGYADGSALALTLTATDQGGKSAMLQFQLVVDQFDPAPVLQTPIADQHAVEAQPFSYTFGDVFTDPDGGELNYSLFPANGQSMPHWVRFDAQTRTISGTPDDFDTGLLQLRLAATDRSGQTTFTDFNIVIDNVNQAPIAAFPVFAPEMHEGDSAQFFIDQFYFADPDRSDRLTYSVTMANGDPLPDWIVVDASDPAFLTVRAKPGYADSGELMLKAIATDPFGLTASQDFKLVVRDVDPAPIQVLRPSSPAATEATPYSHTFGADIFADPDGGPLHYTLTMADGNPLPAWLSFDPQTRTVAGTPGDADTGIFKLRLNAFDTGGQSDYAEYTFTVKNINQAPVLAKVVADQTVEDNLPFSISLPDGLFGDADAGDSGTLSMSGLPAWASFDSQSRTVSGNAPYDAGSTGLTLTWTDSGGLTASTTFTLNVAAAAPLTLTGNAADNILTGKSGSDILTGLGGNDTLNGGFGADQMTGGTGNDLYLVDHAGDVVTERAAEGTDTVQSNVSYALGANLEKLTLAGTASVNGAGNTLNNTLVGNSGANVLDGGAGGDSMSGGAGNDTYLIDSTSDTVFEAAGEGIDLLISAVSRTLGANQDHLKLTGSAVNGTGNTLNNLIQGNAIANALSGGDGHDILQGAGGNDTLSDTSAMGNVFDGGDGADRLSGGAGRDLYLGGAGVDTITTGSGADVIAFNRGDGQDAVTTVSGADNTVSLGNGILYADLALAKSGSDLILQLGAGEQISFKGWYGSNGKSVGTLQVVTEGGADFVADSTSAIHDNQIEQFDFSALVAKFDQARLAQPGITSWSMESSLAQFSTGGSDSAAIGGDLAYLYATEDALSALGASAALGIVGSPQFGTGAQALQPGSAVNDGAPLLY